LIIFEFLIWIFSKRYYTLNVGGSKKYLIQKGYKNEGENS